MTNMEEVGSFGLGDSDTKGVHDPNLSTPFTPFYTSQSVLRCDPPFLRRKESLEPSLAGPFTPISSSPLVERTNMS